MNYIIITLKLMEYKHLYVNLFCFFVIQLSITEWFAITWKVKTKIRKLKITQLALSRKNLKTSSNIIKVLCILEVIQSSWNPNFYHYKHHTIKYGKELLKEYAANDPSHEQLSEEILKLKEFWQEKYWRRYRLNIKMQLK